MTEPGGATPAKPGAKSAPLPHEGVSHPQDQFSASFPWRALITVAIWGASFVAIRVALTAFTPTGLVALRLVVGSSLLGLLMRARRGRWLPARADLGRCVLLGVVLGGHLLIQAVGLQYTTAIHTGWIIGIIPAMIALGAHCFLGQRMQPAGWLGMAVASAGILLVTSVQPGDFTDAGFGDALQLVSCVTWTVYTLAAIGVLSRNDPLQVTAFSMAVAAAVVVPALPFQGLLTATPDVSAWAAVAFLALVCSALAYLLWSQALESHGATRVGSMLYVEPLFTLLVAVAVLDEPVSPRSLLGGALVILGVWVVGSRASSRGRTERQPRRGR